MVGAVVQLRLEVDDGVSRHRTARRGFLDAALDEALNLVELRLADQRPHRGLCIERVSDPHGLDRLPGDRHGLVALRAMHQHPGRRLA